MRIVIVHIAAFVGLVLTGVAHAQHDWFDPDYEYEHSENDGEGYDGVRVNGALRNFAPIHVAAARGDVEVILGEIREGVPPDLAVTDQAGSAAPSGITPLMIAAEFGRVEAMRALLDAGADPNLGHPQHGMTPLMIAAGTVPTIGGDPNACVRLLLDCGANTEAQNQSGRTAVFYAAGGCYGLVRIPEAALTEIMHLPDPFPNMRKHVGGSFVGGGGYPTEETVRARLGDSSRLRLFIEAGADVNGRAVNGYTPLMAAAEQLDAARVRLLLEAGADIAAVEDRGGWNSLDYAAMGGSIEVFEALLAAGAAITREPFAGKHDSTLHMAARSHIEAAEKVQALIDAGAPIDALSSTGDSVLSAAIATGGGAAARPLLEAGADPFERDEDGDSLLIQAMTWSCADAVAALVEHGLDVNERASDWRGLNPTPLILAASSSGDSAAKVRILLDAGANVEARTTNGISALHAAARQGNMEAVVALVKAGADVNERHPEVEETESGSRSPGYPPYTPLMLVAYRGQSSTFMSDETGEEAIRALLGAGADVNAALPTGETALSYAVQAEQPEVVRLLLEAGADPNTEVGNGDDAEWMEFTSPLLLAIEFEDLEAVTRLLKCGAHPNLRPEHAMHGPIHYACETGRPDMVKLLIDAGADINAPCYEGATPLMICFLEWGYESSHRQRDDLGVVRLLLDSRAAIDARDDHGMTALMHFAQNYSISDYEDETTIAIASLLLQRGARLDLTDNDGMTAFHHAANGHLTEIIDLLLERGANLRALDKRGRTALDIARDRWRNAQWTVPSLVRLEDLFAD